MRVLTAPKVSPGQLDPGNRRLLAIATIAVAFTLLGVGLLVAIGFSATQNARSRLDLVQQLGAQRTLISAVVTNSERLAREQNHEFAAEIRDQLSSDLGDLRFNSSVVATKFWSTSRPIDADVALHLYGDGNSDEFVRPVIASTEVLLLDSGIDRSVMDSIAHEIQHDANEALEHQYQAIDSLVASTQEAAQTSLIQTLAILGAILLLTVVAFFGLFVPQSRRNARNNSKIAREGARFQSLVESFPDAMIGADRSGLIALVNSQTEQLFGFKRDELLGQPIEVLIPQRYREAHVNHRTGYADDPNRRSMGTRAMNLVGKRRDEAEFPVDVSLSPVETPDGPLMIAAIRDITERMEAQQAEENRTRELEAVVAVAALVMKTGTVNERISRALRHVMRVAEATTASYYALDDAGDLRLISAAGDSDFVKRLKSDGLRARDGGLARTAFETAKIQVAADYANEPKRRDSVMRMGVQSLVSIPITSAEGAVGVLVVTAQPLDHFDPGKVKMLSGIANSMGAVVQQARLLDSEQRRSLQLAALLKINRFLAGKGTFEERAEAVLQVMAELVGARRARLRMFDQTTRGLKLIAKVGSDPNSESNGMGFAQEAYEAEITMLRQGHGTRGRSTSRLAVPIKTPSGTLGVVAMGADTRDYFDPETVALVESMVEAVGALVETQRMRTEVDVQLALAQRRDGFIATASHELRTPMTSLVGLSELLLLREPDAEERRAWYTTMNRESRRLTDILSEMLDVTRIQSGEVTINATPMGLDEVVHDVVIPIAASSSSHDVHIELPEHLPQIFVDRGKMSQVLLNLVSNAVKYSPEGGEVFVRARMSESGQEVLLSVEDQGIGIDPADASKLFEPFGRIKNSQTASIGGTGLGLYITRNLARLMGGDVWLDSAPSKGSIFHVSIPIATQAMAA